MKFIRIYKVQILSILVGVIIGLLVNHLFKINFEDKVNPVDFANLFVTLILAIVIAFYVEPSNESVRVEKDLLIEQLKDLKSSVKDIHSLFVLFYDEAPLQNVNKQKFITSFRSTSNQLDLFINQMNHCNNNLSAVEETELKNTFFRYKKTLTGGNFNSLTFTFSSASEVKYETLYLNLTKKINHLILDINKS